VTSSGSQCEYYDFWTNLYKYYRVYDAKIKVTFAADTNTAPHACFLFPWYSVSAPTAGIDEYMSLPMA